MKNGTLEFVIANAPELEFDLVQEAWLDGQLIADVRRVEGVWQVFFYADTAHHSIEWDIFDTVHHTFAAFIRAQSEQGV